MRGTWRKAAAITLMAGILAVAGEMPAVHAAEETPVRQMRLQQSAR